MARGDFNCAGEIAPRDRKSTRLNSSHRCISYDVFCFKKKKMHLVHRGLAYPCASAHHSVGNEYRHPLTLATQRLHAPRSAVAAPRGPTAPPIELAHTE